MAPLFERFKGVYIIAEVGLNHNGDLDEAKELIEAAVRAGANGVKIQVRDLDALYTAAVLKDPLKAEQGTQYILNELRKANLTREQVRELFDFSKRFEADFFATPFDAPSALFLNDLEAGMFKIGSPDFTNLPLIDLIVGFGKPVILSTGMSDESEIGQVVSFLKGKKAKFSLLHCNSTYPASYTDLNLNYIPALKALSNAKVGYSGHEQGIAPTLAAVALGAEIIERHITRDTGQSGPDHRASLTIPAFAEMAAQVRAVEQSLGVAKRANCQGEKNNRLTLAKSLVAARDLQKGEILDASDLVAKSPAKGISPLKLGELLGKKLTRSLSKDDYVFPEDVEGSAAAIAEKTYQINRHWGIVGRLNDFRDFLDLKPKLVEIHMTWRDLLEYKGAPEETFSQDLVVHAPEYYKDRLIDFSSPDAEVTEYSLEMLRKTIEIARDLAPRFKGLRDPRGPRIVVHPGGHFRSPVASNKNEQYRLLVKNLKDVDSSGTQLLVENMPPFPWYFGGQWYNTIFLDGREIAQFAEEIGWGICYDTSHALLHCNHAGLHLREFTRAVLPHVRYLHVSDAKGVTEEGLQLGQGNLDFEHLGEILRALDVGFIPEIWQGHLNHGQGFREALSILESAVLEKFCGPSCSNPGHAHSQPLSS